MAYAVNNWLALVYCMNGGKRKLTPIIGWLEVLKNIMDRQRLAVDLVQRSGLVITVLGC